MEYDYYPVKRHSDNHNRIFGGKFWCIQVRISSEHYHLQYLCSWLIKFNLNISKISGYLRDNMCGHDMVPHSLRRVRGDESNAIAKPLSNLQIRQHGHLQLWNLPCGFKSLKVNVLRSGRCAKRQRYQRKHSTDGLSRRRGNL